jgi:hypothetical protein
MCASSSLLWGNQCVKGVRELVADVSSRTKVRQHETTVGIPNDNDALSEV